MKKGIIACLIASLIIGNPLSIDLSRSFESSKATIIGKVSPAEAADVAWLIGAKDTLKTAVVSGTFSQSVPSGRYKLIVDAKEPYKDAMMDNLDVKQDQVLDVGEIILQR